MLTSRKSSLPNSYSSKKYLVHCGWRVLGIVSVWPMMQGSSLEKPRVASWVTTAKGEDLRRAEVVFRRFDAWRISLTLWVLFCRGILVGD